MGRKRIVPAVGSRAKLGLTMNEVVKGHRGVVGKRKLGVGGESSRGDYGKSNKRNRKGEPVAKAHLNFMEQLIGEGFGGPVESEEESEKDDDVERASEDEPSEHSEGSYREKDAESSDEDEFEMKSKRAKVKGVTGNSRRSRSKLGEVREAVLARLIDPQQQLPDNRPLGVIVTEKERVVETQVFNCSRKPPNVICRVDAFSKLVSEFDPSRVKVVKEMGFGSLLKLQINRLDRKFCYWLLTRVDPESCVMVFGDGKELPLCPVQWNLVLGIPYGREPVPLTCDVLDKTMHERIRVVGGWFGTVDARGRTHLSVRSAEKAILKKLDKTTGALETEEDVLHFKSAFLVVVLGQLLCPSTDGGNLSISLLPAVSVAGESEKYNWCEFAFDWLMAYVLKFKQKFNKYGYVAGCGGCTLFLLIFYIDHLSLTPNYWDDTPRIGVWTQAQVMGVIEADRKASGDYGNVKSVDVAYGERHPRIARDKRVPPDLIGKSIEDAIVRRVLKVLDPRLENIEKMLETLTRMRGRASSTHERVLQREVGRPAKIAQPCEGVVDVNLEASRKGSSLENGLTVDDFGLLHPHVTAEFNTDGHDLNVEEQGLPLEETLRKIAADVVLPLDENGDGGLGNRNDESLEGNVANLPIGNDDSNGCEVGSIINSPGEDDGNIRTETVLGSKCVEGGEEVGRIMNEVDNGLNKEGDNQGLSGEVAGGDESDLNKQKGETKAEGASGVVLGGGNENPTVDGNGAASLSSLDVNEEGFAGQRNPDNKRKTSRAQPGRSASKRARGEVVLPDKTRMLGCLERKILSLIRNWSPRSDKSRGISLIRCDGMDATTGDCHGVLYMRERVSSQYVRMAAKLYTKEWAKKYKGKSKRIMLDVTFSLRVIADVKTPEVSATKHGQNVKGLTSQDIAVMFVPVLEEEHWWCAAFDLKENNIWLIDSMYPDAATTHRVVLQKLAYAVDVLLNTYDRSWELSTATSWPNQNVQVLEPTDNNSCGVVMLLCIKECAYRFMHRFGVGNLKDARDSLLYDDLYSEFNELELTFEELIYTGYDVFKFVSC